MTSQELKQKFDAAVIAADKRLNTIEKLCKKLDIESDELLNQFHLTIGTEFKMDYLPSRTSNEIVSKFVEEKPIRDSFGNWHNENYEFNSKVSQLIDNLPKLYELLRVAHNWDLKYNIQLNKENAEKIESIWNFLCEWETKALNWYRQNAAKYIELHQNEKSELEAYKNSDEYAKDHEYQSQLHKYSVDYYTEKAWRDNYYDEIDNFTKIITNTYKETIDEELLTKTIAKEKLNKYFDLVDRVTKVVGDIVDASHLRVGNQNGELNGFIIGSKGKCKVETISAGGYNIQCFHYRVLIHEVKD